MPLDPITDDDWPPALAHLKDSFIGRGNVYRVMAHHPALVSAWSGLRQHVVTRNALGDERLEVVILRVGHRLGAAYEWDHHVVRARKAGLSDRRIAAMRGAPDAMEGADALLARAVDDLVDHGRLSAGLQSGISTELGTEAMLDLIATVGFYTTLAFIVKSFDTPLDAEIAAELTRAPLAP
ncbi:carboxymuconolactone decarboxylase family protein [Limibaculum sp. FT325]|uniref:carboxymuconolactone decarboxylase family protein n=1 Tax=Thermohalobaculum sediminis TaxID=2939436 RepID=UPI0020BE5963|nr:carboxymuconolactone decarboxylase family protein [Limibaculum sediminis]MCL5778669.1 carboxymuconolactone decarboxylase family protein [Limibaculum sediminis]